MSKPLPVPGAIALLEKYATLNSAIEEARQRISNAKSELETSREKIQHLYEERAKMKQDTEDTTKKIYANDAELKKGTKRLTELESFWTNVVNGREKAARELDLTRRLANEERVAFLDRCREFRKICRHIRLSASILNVDDNNMNRPDMVVTNQNFICYSFSSDEINGHETLEEGGGKHKERNEDEIMVDESSTLSPMSVSIPSRWDHTSAFFETNTLQNVDVQKNNKLNFEWLSRVPGKVKEKRSLKKQKEKTEGKAVFDTELSQAEKKDKESLGRKIEAKHCLDGAKIDRQEAGRRSNDRAKKLEQQRTQLKRIRKDVDQMEKDISELEQTNELRHEDAFCRMRHNGVQEECSKNGSNGWTLYPTTFPDRQSTTSLTIDETILSPHFTVTPSPHYSSKHDTHDLPSRTLQKISRQHKQIYHQSSVTVIKNPYKKNLSQSKTTSEGHQNQEKYCCHQGTESYKTSLAMQHPHREGRIRIDKQFSTALEITSREESDSKDESVCSEEKNTFELLNSSSPISHCVQFSMDKTNASTDHKLSLMLLEESDDDDLFNYATFRKEK